ncbi:MAG: hypothetical protein WCJ74_00930 [bacterium]
MSLTFDILKAMSDARLKYKGVEVNGFGIPTFLIKNKQSFKSTLSRLKKNGYVLDEKGMWKITPKGKKLVEERIGRLQTFKSPFTIHSKKNLLLFFDIPEPQKAKREWLRNHLINFNYKMIQRSVWLGPSPLPKDFTEYLKSIKIEKYIKTYKLAKDQN